MTIRPTPEAFKMQVFLEDTDAGGVVYHAQYLCFMERARHTYFYHKGVDHAQCILNNKACFVVAHMDVKYKRPARCGDYLSISTALTAVRGASIECQQTIFLEKNETYHCCVEATVKLAYVCLNSYKPIALPDQMRSTFLCFQTKEDNHD